MEELTDEPVSRKIEHQLIRKILAIVGLYFLCTIIILDFSRLFIPRTRLTNTLRDVFAVLNSSMNITIYCGFDRKFREEFKNMICCCLNSKRDKNETILSNIIVVKWFDHAFLRPSNINSNFVLIKIIITHFFLVSDHKLINNYRQASHYNAYLG